ncbi:unnamed protein product [Peniophora sp. CBMAI 1063]|nr:unnamed protein product [Peniophora sp. CBMAI 1063]
MLISLFTVNFFVSSAWSRVAMAGNLTTPTSWKGVTLNLSRSSCEELAGAAAMALVQEADPSTPNSDLPYDDFHISSFAVLALQDYYSGNTTWGNTVTNGIQAFTKRLSDGLYGTSPRVNSEALYWGLAYFYAYRTYNQSWLLDSAISAYNKTYATSFIDDTVASSGSGAGRNISFRPPPGCTNWTIAGGVFWNLDTLNNTTINSETVSPFMALSSYLYEETGDPFYAQTTQMSLEFIIHHLWNGTVVHDSFFPNTCTLDDTIFLTYNQAWFVEGLSVWANITRNDTLTSFLTSVVSSVTTFPGWTLSSGVIDETGSNSDDSAILKGIFIRGLAEARARNPDTDLAKYIEAYILVQFNSLLENSRAPAPNNSFYGTSWFTSRPQSFIAAGNIAALDVLNAAFSFATPTSDSPTASSPSMSTSSSMATSTGSDSNTGAIAGGVVGSAAVTLAVIVGLFLYRRRSRAKRIGLSFGGPFTGNSGVMVEDENTVQPFVLPASPSRLSKWQRFNSPRVDREALTASSPGDAPLHDSGDAHNTTSGREPRSTEGDVRDRRAMSESTDHDIAELPTLVRRLNTLLQGRGGELPPEYEG